MIRINLTKGHFSSTVLAFFLLCFHGQLLSSMHSASLLLCRVFLFTPCVSVCVVRCPEQRGACSQAQVTFSSALPLAPSQKQWRLMQCSYWEWLWGSLGTLMLGCGTALGSGLLLWSCRSQVGFCVHFFVCFLFQIYMILGSINSSK